MSPSISPAQSSSHTAEQSQAMMQMITGYWTTQAIYTATKLGVADHLENGPKSVEQLSTTIGADPDFLYRILRALSSIGIFEETAEQQFQQTPMSDILRSAHPNTMRPIVEMLGEEHYVAWGALKDATLSGKLPFESVYGMGVFEYFKQNPEAGNTFNAAMTSFVKNDHASIAAAYDFSAFNTVVDVGGGKGMLLSLILQKFPSLKGILFDLPHVVSGAEAYLQQANVSDRCTIEQGDFFQAIAPGGDAYILSHIIHDWSDEKSIAILKNVKNAMNADGRVLLVEFVIEPGNQVPMTKFMDLNMLVMTPGGRERTREEYSRLFEQAGLRLTQIIPTATAISIIEAVKA